jgi:hypothetical protein
MDPYVERPEIWPDFHDRLITYIGEALQPLLRPRYAALTQERLYVVESDRPIRPDLSVVATSAGGRLTPAAVAVEPDTPLVVELYREEIREPVLHIIEPAAGNRIVTAIEVLSPSNKFPGAGRDSYLEKQDELWYAGTHLVEIDLLRAGESTVRVSQDQLARLGKRHYLVAVTRARPTRCELYGVKLQHALPNVNIPLAGKDPDVVLELQSVFERCWKTGPYPQLLRCDGAPPGELSEGDADWCTARLREAGLGGGDHEGGTHPAGE